MNTSLHPSSLRLTCTRRGVILAIGGGERDRTDDPLLAKQVLSQLSYTPVSLIDAGQQSGGLPPSSFILPPSALQLVGLVGVEPTTPALSRRCSNQLSYRPLDFEGLGVIRGAGPALDLPSP